MRREDDAQGRYEAALELVDLIYAQWEALGKPLTTEGGATGRALVPHPLVKMLAEARRDADRFERALRGRHRGPKPSAVVEASVGASPAARMRAVK